MNNLEKFKCLVNPDGERWKQEVKERQANRGQLKEQAVVRLKEIRAKRRSKL
ncbi:hypothetical protein [Persicobacter diffluens]|uniref:hypothetical protein n=1 Tax=Persicobacter diffluens TaxID=981 RepID=UPI0030C67835